MGGEGVVEEEGGVGGSGGRFEKGKDGEGDDGGLPGVGGRVPWGAGGGS